MAEIEAIVPTKLICGILFHGAIDLKEVMIELEEKWGTVETISDRYLFSLGSNYYENEMGQPLYRVFCSFKKLISPETLASQKLLTQSIEAKWSQLYEHVPRPLNLDPGYIARGRMVLATTKDFSHRIYLHSGIYAEVTLMFRKHGVKKLEWTYPDIASGFWDEFLLSQHKKYHRQLEPLIE